MAVGSQSAGITTLKAFNAPQITGLRRQTSRLAEPARNTTGGEQAARKTPAGQTS
jgi:hypothetical protein